MSEKAHSEIGASSAHRWFVCPGSVRLSHGLPRRSSVYAAEGTVAHTLGQIGLTTDMPPSSYLGATRSADGYDFLVDQEMVDGVQLYIDTVRSTLEPGGVLQVEKQFDLSSLHEGLYGTADAVTWSPKSRLLIVDDFKYGAGVMVEPEMNPQQMYYALGALLETKYPADKVALRITQPRYPHPDGVVRTWTMPALDLLDFAADLKKYAVATEDPNAPLVPGEHCKFCPAAAVCPALKSQVQKSAALTFADAALYDPGQLAAALTWADQVEAWAKNVREFAYSEAMRGNTPPGFKLVQKKARRKWRSEGEVIEYLQLLGHEDKDIFEPRQLKSPAQMEKVLSKNDVAAHVIKESSGLTLVQDSDPRPAVQKTEAKDVFNVVSEQ